jgi:hypothetical protein
VNLASGRSARGSHTGANNSHPQQAKRRHIPKESHESVIRGGDVGSRQVADESDRRPGSLIRSGGRRVRSSRTARANDFVISRSRAEGDIGEVSMECGIGISEVFRSRRRPSERRDEIGTGVQS